MSTECDEHLFGPGQKRILALDGGGTLGIIELAFLERIETLLRAARGGDPGFRLCQWFDLIGGTSTGAIIAACLATGMSAGEVTQLYLDLAPRAFRRRRWRITGLTARFDAAPLARFLQEIFGSQTLDSDDIRTGLAIMARRYDTGSPWLISNNPRAPYWHDPPDRRYRGNRHYRLASMIRASTAAPGLFRPELVEIVEGEPAGLFIDGGLSPYNNPSLSLLMLSQARAFGLQWKMSPENLSLISLGAGLYRHHPEGSTKPPLLAADLLMRALMNTLADGQLLTLTLLQWFGESAQPWQINSEIGDLSGEVLGERPLLRFQRYDMPLEIPWLRENLKKNLSARELKDLRRIDNAVTMRGLHAMATTAAAQQVQLQHLL
jgi:hypothetical protein